jgi:hypothetical protein
MDRRLRMKDILHVTWWLLVPLALCAGWVVGFWARRKDLSRLLVVWWQTLPPHEAGGLVTLGMLVMILGLYWLGNSQVGLRSVPATWQGTPATCVSESYLTITADGALVCSAR